MENKNQLWQSGVKKAFHGFVGSVLFRLFAAICTAAIQVWAVVHIDGGDTSALAIFNALSKILAILSFLFFVYHFSGVKNMKDAAAGTLYKKGVDKLFKGSLCLLISGVVSFAGMFFISITAFYIIVAFTVILNIVGYVFMIMAFDAMRKLMLDELTAKGAKQLWILAILSIVANLLGVIPFVGVVFNIVILALAFTGWKNFSNSSLDMFEETVLESGNQTGLQSKETEECEPADEESANNQVKERTFFLNRWIAKLARWFDGDVFNLAGNDKAADSSSLCIWALWIGFMAGASIAVAEMINEGSTFPYWAAGIGAGLILIMVVFKAVNDAKKLASGAQIAGRVAYLILLPFAVAFIGCILAAIAVIIVAVVLFLWFLLTMLFGTNDKVRLSNNDVVRNDGILGGYRGKSGRKYSKNIDGTYTPED